MPERYIAAQNGLVKLALKDLAKLWATLNLADADAATALLAREWPRIIARHGEIAATMAADRFEDITGLRASMVRPVDVARARARARWAMGPLYGGDRPDSAFARMAGLTDELLKQAGRSSMARSARENKIRYVRVPVGPTCAWCITMASRGPMSSGGTAFHPGDDCRIEPVRDGKDLERLQADGYDLSRYRDIYGAAADKAGSTNLKKVLAAMRENEGIP